jgi:hypothetical protein
MECLEVALEAPGVRRVAILYGGLHMPGLTRALRGGGQQDSAFFLAEDSETREGLKGLGFEPSTVRWRSVWRVEAPETRAATRWVAIPAFLFLDGADWASTVNEAAVGMSQEMFFSAFLVCALYIVRHAAVYYSLGKWVLEWNKQLFDARDGDDGPDGSDGLTG